MYIQDATKLFEQGKISEYVERDYKSRYELAIEKRDAKLLERVKYKIKEKTITLFAMSLEACDLLDLPKDKFYDLYFRGDYTNQGNLLRGMHVKGMMKILEFNGHKLKVIKETNKECTVEFILEDGCACRHSLTIEDALETPWIDQEIKNSKDGKSLWVTNRKEMLLHEVVKFICKTMYRRLFKARPRCITNDLGVYSNRQLAEQIFDEKIYDIQSVDFNYLETFKLLKSKGDEEATLQYIRRLRDICVNKITASLDLCDAYKLPKAIFYDVAKYELFHEDNLAYNIRPSCCVDVLRECGYIIRPEGLSSRSATIRYSVNGVEEVQQVSLESLCASNAKIKEQVENETHVWHNNTMLMLFYEVVNQAMKSCFPKVRVRKEKTPEGEEREQFFNMSTTDRQDERTHVDDVNQPEGKPDTETEEDSKLHKSRRGLVIPESYTEFVKNNKVAT